VEFWCYEERGELTGVMGIQRLVDDAEMDRLLKQYWDIPERQVETSIVLVEQ